MANISDLAGPQLDMFGHQFRLIYSGEFLAYTFIFPAVWLLICIVALSIEHCRRSQWPGDELEQEGISEMLLSG